MAEQTKDKKKEQVTMKKGSAVVNVDVSRRNHYEKLGYKISKNSEDNKTDDEADAKQGSRSR